MTTAGFSVWDASGTLVIDTTRRVLRELVVTNILSSSTAEQAVALPSTGPATVVAQEDARAVPGQAGGDYVTSSIDSGFLKYRFYQANQDAEIRALLF